MLRLRSREPAFFVTASLFTGLLVALGACTHGDPATLTGSTGSGGAGGTTTSTVSTTTTSAVVTSTSTSSTGTGGAGGDNGMPSDVYPAPHPAPPQSVDYGGPVLAAPVIIPIFFSNADPTLKASLVDFETQLGTTQLWAEGTSEYGAGPTTVGAVIELPDTATGTIDDSDIQAWLKGKLNGDDPAFPMMPYGDVIFAIHYPAGVIITYADGMGGLSHSCVDFGAYHDNISLDGAHGNRLVSYAVLPICDPFGELTGVDEVTAVESHELAEAVTDPYPEATPAYAGIDPQHRFWESYLGGGEVADMCTRLPNSFEEFPELPYTVQRLWSNKAALAGHDPCVPALPGSVYFNAAAVLPDNVLTNVLGEKMYVKGVKIPVGQTGVFELDLFSDGDTGGPFSVDVEDAGPWFGDTSSLDISLDRYEGVNGEKLHVSVTVDQPGQDNSELLVITSSLGDVQNVWLAVIGN